MAAAISGAGSDSTAAATNPPPPPEPPKPEKPGLEQKTGEQGNSSGAKPPSTEDLGVTFPYEDPANPAPHRTSEEAAADFESIIARAGDAYKAEGKRDPLIESYGARPLPVENPAVSTPPQTSADAATDLESIVARNGRAFEAGGAPDSLIESYGAKPLPVGDPKNVYYAGKGDKAADAPAPLPKVLLDPALASPPRPEGGLIDEKAVLADGPERQFSGDDIRKHLEYVQLPGFLSDGSSLPLAPTAANDVPAASQAPNVPATPASVQELFVNGPPEGAIDAAAIERLDGWLPDAIQNGGGNYVRDKQRAEDIVSLAKSMGYEGSQVWERDGRDSEKRATKFTATGAASFLKEAARQDAVLNSAAELPSSFDMFDAATTDSTDAKLGGMDNEARKDSFLRRLNGGTDLLDRKADFEKSDFQKLDEWLPEALAGRGEIAGDAESQALLVKFAERLGWSNVPEKPGSADRGSAQFAGYETARRAAEDMPVAEKAAAALSYLKNEQFLQRSLVAGSEAGDEKARIIFEEGFVGQVVQHGVNQGVITDQVAVQAAMTADVLMTHARAAMEGGEAGADGGPVALDPGMFAQALAQQLPPDAIDPKRMMAGFNYVQRAETGEQQQLRLTETMLAFQTKAEAGIGAMSRSTWTEGLAAYSNKLADVIGRRIEDPTNSRMSAVLDHVGVPGYEKIKISKGTKLHLANDETGRVADIQVEKKQNGFARLAMDAVMTGLSFTPAAPAAMGYFAMRGVEAAVKGDGIGAVTAGLGAVGGFAGSFAAAANGANAAAKIAQAARLASGAIGVHQGIKNGDLMGAIAGGISAFSAGAQLNGAASFANSAANLERAVNGLDAAMSKDYLAAASSFASAAGKQFGADKGIADASGNIEKITTLASGILNKDASQIVSAFGDQIAGFTKDWPGLNQPAPPPTNPFGPNTAFDDQGNPIILQAGYGDGDAPVDPEQQQRLNDFANVQGAPILPSPARPDNLTTPANTSPEEQISLYQADLRLQQHSLEYQRAQLPDNPNPRSPAAGRASAIDAQLDSLKETISVLDSLRLVDPRVGQAPEILHFDPSGDDKIVVGYGDIENADDIAVLIPGTFATLNDFQTSGDGKNNERLVQIKRRMDFEPGMNGAIIGYLGYDAPDNLFQAASSSYGKDGAADLHAFLDGLPANAKIHLLPYSYGNVLSGEALMDGARPDVVYGLGSPGPGSDFQYESAWNVEMFDVINPGDPVPYAPVHGPTPPEGSTRLMPFGEGHYEYFDPSAIVEMIMGRWGVYQQAGSPPGPQR